MAAMKKFSSEILRCAPSRLQEELVRLLASGHAKENMDACLEVGVLNTLMPELLEGMGILTQAECEPVSEEEKQETFSYWQSLLLALDRVFAKDCNIVSSVAFTALLLPAYTRLEKSAHNERNWIDRLCVNWSERIRLTRRDQDLIRILLSAIPLFHIDKIHQKSAQYLVRKPWFKEALLAYILHLEAQKLPLDEIKIWKLLAHDADRNYRQDKHSNKPVPVRFRKRRLPMRNQNRRFGNNRPQAPTTEGNAPRPQR